MPHPLALLALFALLPACDSYAPGAEDYPPNPAGDLRVVQAPNDTVRAGQTMRLTAAFADSLKGYQVIWLLVGGPAKTGRVVEWQAPAEPGTYYNGVRVEAGVNGGATSLTFTTHVAP